MSDIMATRGNDWRQTQVMSTQTSLFAAENPRPHQRHHQSLHDRQRLRAGQLASVACRRSVTCRAASSLCPKSSCLPHGRRCFSPDAVFTAPPPGLFFHDKGFRRLLDRAKLAGVSRRYRDRQGNRQTDPETLHDAVTEMNVAAPIRQARVTSLRIFCFGLRDLDQLTAFSPGLPFAAGAAAP